MIAVLPLLLAAMVQTADARGPAAPDQPQAPARRVDGRVVLGRRAGQDPLDGLWVVLHRVGHDHSGPLDSTRTAGGGHFHFRYQPSGDTAAIYFATTSFGGIVYPTAPFRGPMVSGDDAMLVVFDTTSGPIAIGVSGRHLIVGAPNASGRRPIGEVFDLENDSIVTAIARGDSIPVWSTHIPPEAVGFQVNVNGELGAAALARKGSTVGLFAPLSPGLRQVAFTYELPADAFPLRVPVTRPTAVFELLVQEPTARLAGAPFREVPPQAAEGRVFRRFLAQDLPANVAFTIDLPRVIGAGRNTVYRAVGGVVLGVMLLALIYAIRRARPPASGAESPSTVWVRRLASLDDEFERVGDAGTERRAAYESERAVIKERLAAAMAAERRPRA